MSGHSKWSTIKHKKGASDAKRGKLFTKLIKEITVAARVGGGDPDGNPRLRLAISNARSSNMPGTNIERAIKKGTGELEGVTYEEVTYEGYGPQGVAVLAESVTDNKNRTVAEIRNVFSKNGGNLGETGCVNWMFKKQGILTFDKKDTSEEKLMEIALEAGADDIKDEEDSWEVTATPENFESVKVALEKTDLNPTNAEIAMVAENTVKIEDEEKSSKGP